MIRALTPVAPLLLGITLLMFGSSLQGLLLPLRAQIENFGQPEIGLLGSAYFVGFTLGCFRGPRIVQNVGHIRAFAAIVALASCVILAHSLFVLPAIWWLLRGATGFCFAILFMIIESWLNEKSDNSSRGAVFSTYAMIVNGVGTLGQLTVATSDPQSFEMFAVGSILISLAAVPVALSRREAPAPIAEVRIRPMRIFRFSPVGFIGCLVTGLTNGAFGALLAVYALRMGFDTLDIALLAASPALAAAIVQWPLGWLSDKIDRRIVLIGAAAAACLAGLFLSFQGGGSPTAVFIGVIAFGCFSFPLYALAVAHANDFAAPGEMVETASGLLLIWSLGGVAGPIIASVAMSQGGASALFVFTAVAHAGLAGYTGWRITRRAAPAAEDRGRFTEAMVVSQTVGPVELTEPEEALED
ncbi:MFS transporter (plasmid) [Paroceanicella profunda]|uniref:MFS transporter n=1 Tax=Paroceanicella profunda TaxID=2579971 RepID=A0A5B8FJ14_9RHOB|nr:MFS transporter [Paroceanicella profunda]QDL94391.1 MFS transporter [Paroceanicella profunda]